jgi:hypothetical protein
MADFISLSCPSCGGKLQITSDIDRFACAHCGNEHIVRRSGGIVSLAPVAESLNNIKAGVDKTASELAIKRLSDEISQISSRISILKQEAFEREKKDPTYASRSPLGRALHEIVKVRGAKLPFTFYPVEQSLYWFIKNDTHLTTEEYDFLIQKVPSYNRRYPIVILSEMRDLERQITIKNNELKHHQSIVGLS